MHLPVVHWWKTRYDRLVSSGIHVPDETSRLKKFEEIIICFFLLIQIYLGQSIQSVILYEREKLTTFKHSLCVRSKLQNACNSINSINILHYTSRKIKPLHITYWHENIFKSEHFCWCKRFHSINIASR